jgi:hypothetical protein
MLWSHPDEIPVVERMVEPFFTSATERLNHVFTKVVEVAGEFAERRRIARNEGDVAKLALEARGKVQTYIDEMRSLSTKLYSEQEKRSLEEQLQRSYTYLKQLDHAAGL